MAYSICARIASLGLLAPEPRSNPARTDAKAGSLMRVAAAGATIVAIDSLSRVSVESAGISKSALRSCNTR